jgi:transcriptional regulator with XRE-family HTH domain
MSQTETPSAEDARSRAASVLRALKGYRRMTDDNLAKAVKVSRSGVQGYMANKTQMTIGLMYDFARALDVDPVVFLMTADEALRWAIENAPNSTSSVGGSRLRWTHASPREFAAA